MDSDSSSEDTAVLVARNTGIACFEYHREYHRDLSIRLEILEVQNALVLRELQISRRLILVLTGFLSAGVVIFAMNRNCVHGGTWFKWR